MAIISLKNIKFKYPKSDRWAINIDNWQVSEKEHVFIYGPSGSGKSTLLNLLAGVIKPQQGQLTVAGYEFDKLSAHKVDDIRATYLGVVFQQLNLIPYLTVSDNILLGQYFSKNKPSEVQARLLELCEHLGLEQNILDKKANHLSVGQQQRVAIARALIGKPQILIVDEPTSALDTDSRDGFMKLLMKVVAQEQTTLIFVSHDMSLCSHFVKTVALNEINNG